MCSLCFLLSQGGRLELWSPALKQSEGVVLEYSTSPPPAQQLLTAGGAAGSAPASPARQQGGSRKGWTPATLPPPPSGGQQSVLLLDNGKHISVVSVVRVRRGARPDVFHQAGIVFHQPERGDVVLWRW